LGAFESNRFLLTQAFSQSLENKNLSDTIAENPFSRNYYLVAIKKLKKDEMTEYISPYFYGELFCIYISILYGKRFDYHGLLEESGVFYTPNPLILNPIKYYYLGINNHKPRNDLNIELNLSHFKKIEKLFNKRREKEINIIETAGKFYNKAIKIYEEEPEIAFLDLVTSGEILSNYYEYSDEELHDVDLKKIFIQINEKFGKKNKINNIIKARLFQIKRKYFLTIKKLLNDNFFQKTDSSVEYGRLKKDDIDKRIKASYDLRSKYVHNGTKFGHFLYPRSINEINEIQFGVPVIKPVRKNRELIKSLTDSPTIIGLERIIRYCLLKFIHDNIIEIDDQLT